jgi:transcriptional regulator with XRE-family HTH domain
MIPSPVVSSFFIVLGNPLGVIRLLFIRSVFAEKLGITQSMLSRLEKGYTNPPLNILVKLSEVSGKSIDELIKGLED